MATYFLVSSFTGLLFFRRLLSSWRCSGFLVPVQCQGSDLFRHYVSYLYLMHSGWASSFVSIIMFPSVSQFIHNIYFVQFIIILPCTYIVFYYVNTSYHNSKHDIIYYFSIIYYSWELYNYQHFKLNSKITIFFIHIIKLEMFSIIMTWSTYKCRYANTCKPPEFGFYFPKLSFAQYFISFVIISSWSFHYLPVGFQSRSADL